MLITKASVEQFQAVKDFYYSVIDGIGNADDSVAWQKDVYPAPDFLKESIRHGELYIAVEDGKIIGAMVLNHQCNEEYNKVQWPTNAENTEVTVVHALAVLPTHTRRGYAKQMVHFVIDHARTSRQKAVRLDVLKRNIAAVKLYSGMGFRYIDTLPMFYEDIGWTDFDLYEYTI